MKVYSAKNGTTDKRSDEYIEINNCGYLENTSPRINIYREKGRQDYQLIYIKKGEVTFIENEIKTALCDGNIYLYRPGQVQHYKVSKPETTYYWIHFSGTECDKMLAFFEKSYIYSGNSPEFEEICTSYCKDYRLTGDDCDLFYRGKLISLIAMINKKTKKLPITKKDYSAISNIIEYINNNPGTNCSNQEYAAMCSLSKSYFIHLFKEHTGISPQIYKANLLTEKAKFLLKNTNLNISEIAESLGFSDSLYFSRFFKKHTNLSPKSYRLTR